MLVETEPRVIPNRWAGPSRAGQVLQRMRVRRTLSRIVQGEPAVGANPALAV